MMLTVMGGGCKDPQIKLHRQTSRLTLKPIQTYRTKNGHTQSIHLIKKTTKKSQQPRCTKARLREENKNRRSKKIRRKSRKNKSTEKINLPNT